jgi:hypothetical protein
MSLPKYHTEPLEAELSPEQKLFLSIIELAVLDVQEPHKIRDGGSYVDAMDWLQGRGALICLSHAGIVISTIFTTGRLLIRH